MILLASASPQRAWLLKRAGLAFRVVRSLAIEEAVNDPDPLQLALARARAKARAAEPSDVDHEEVVLGADTVVALGTQVFGKPQDDQEALDALTALSGTTHQVITAQHLVRRRQGEVLAEAGAADTVEVTMRVLPASEITAYVASGESRGRAGSYAIQEHGDRFVERLAGAWDTVVGLHLAQVELLHRQLLGCAPERA